MTVLGEPILIRNCEGLDELGACVEMQAEVWGYAVHDVLPRRTFVVAGRIGGQIVGAFDTSGEPLGFQGDAGTMVGFALALPGLAQEGPYLHSHMLAVRPGYRDRGIGRRLKLFQRQDALARGITRMEWTFDPLEIKNAFLNITKLGVLARRYAPNLYGVSSSDLQGSLPTDRLYAEWQIDSARVQAAVADKPMAPRVVERRILVPHAIGGWKRSPGEQHRALEVQAENRRHFEQAFADGLAVLGFVVDAEGNGVFELGPWE